MNALIRNTTKSFNRELDGYGYKQLDQSEETREEKNHGRRTFSRRKSHNNMVHSLSYKSDRAKQRRIFLKSYKLASMDSLRRSTSTRKLRKTVIKVKKVVVSIVSSIRIGLTRSCNCRLSIRASSPILHRKWRLRVFFSVNSLFLYLAWLIIGMLKFIGVSLNLEQVSHVGLKQIK